MSVDEVPNENGPKKEEQTEAQTSDSSTSAPKKSHIETHEENLKIAKQKQ